MFEKKERLMKIKILKEGINEWVDVLDMTKVVLILGYGCIYSI